MNDVTRILSRIEDGDGHAAEELLPLVYNDLRRLAAQKLRHEKADQTLQPTALVHEAYLRLVANDGPQRWDSKRHFYAAAAEAMRRILIEAYQVSNAPSANRRHMMIQRGMILAVSMLLCEFAQGQGKEAYEQLKEYAELQNGRWVGVASVKDNVLGEILGNGEITGQALVTWILDRNAIECNWTFGTAAGKWVAVWDAADQKIRRYAVDTAGTIIQSTVAKEDGTWVARSAGVFGDGRSHSAKVITDVSDEGKTVTYRVTERVVDGEKLPDFVHVWKKVSG